MPPRTKREQSQCQKREGGGFGYRFYEGELSREMQVIGGGRVNAEVAEEVVRVGKQGQKKCLMGGAGGKSHEVQNWKRSCNRICFDSKTTCCGERAKRRTIGRKI